MNKLIVVAGPTAVGKTEYAIRIAKEFNAEIVSCDSMQLYKYMDIGSAKPTPEERAQVKHHLVDEIDPKERFSVVKYCELAEKAITDIQSSGKNVVIAGGTGLYLDSLIYDLDFGPISCDLEYRSELEQISDKEGSLVLHSMLMQCDPLAAERIHPNNTKKLIRALEAAKLGKEGIKDFSDVKDRPRKREVSLIGLTRGREELYDRINKRVLALIDAGLENEVRKLMSMGFTQDDISMKGIGYKEMIAYLGGQYSLDEAIDLVQKNTRHYAKRQMTWFRRYADMKWFDISNGADKFSEICEWVRKNS